ncbi:MAG: polysaccharide biosynthesis protein, partial [Gammaproteobacteria bacterium]
MFHSVIQSISQWFLSRPRGIKRVITLSVDFIAVVVALWLAFSLRYSELYIPVQKQYWVFLLAPAIAIPIFIKFGLYRAIVRYIGLYALGTVFKAVALYTLLFAVIMLIAGPENTGVVPRTVYGINTLILLLFAGGSRLIARWWFSELHIGQQLDRTISRSIPPVVIYGAGASGVQMAVALKLGHQQKPVAFIDDERQLQKRQINGVGVYPFSELSYLIEKFAVRDVLLAMPSASRSRRNEIIKSLEPYPVHVRTLPDLNDITEGKVTVSDIQEVDIADLLGREEVAPIDNLLHANIADKVVMVTGAGG